MLSIRVVGVTTRGWCCYSRVLSLGNGAIATHRLAACPALALTNSPALRRAYRRLAESLNLPELPVADGNLLRQALVRSVAEAGAMGSAEHPVAPLAAGVFTAKRGVIASTHAVTAYKFFPPRVSKWRPELVADGGLSGNGDVSLLELEASGSLSVVVLPAPPGLLPPLVVEKLLEQVEEPKQALWELAQWIVRRDPAQPALLLSYGPPAHHGGLSPSGAAIPRGEMIESKTAQPVKTPASNQAHLHAALEPVLQELKALRTTIESWQEPGAGHQVVLKGMEQVCARIESWPMGELFKHLLNKLDKAEAEHIDRHVLMPLWRYFMELYDTIEQALTEAPAGAVEVLGALRNQVLAGLAYQGIEPFRENGEFNPRTQECVQTRVPPGSNGVLQSLRCGFRRGSEIVRREKLIFRPAEMPGQPQGVTR